MSCTAPVPGLLKPGFAGQLHRSGPQMSKLNKSAAHVQGAPGNCGKTGGSAHCFFGRARADLNHVRRTVELLMGSSSFVDWFGERWGVWRESLNAVRAERTKKQWREKRPLSGGAGLLWLAQRRKSIIPAYFPAYFPSRCDRRGSNQPLQSRGCPGIQTTTGKFTTTTSQKAKRSQKERHGR